jgi:Xaa-Pro aminopeptidase
MNKLTDLRKAMRRRKIDACIILSSDPHMSEYVADHWQGRRYLTGFDGSAGTAIVTRDFAGMWTDSRYFIQAEKQLEGSGFELMKLELPHKPEFMDWLTDNLDEGARVAVDGSTISYQLGEQLEELFEQYEITLVTEYDLVGEIWKNRPPLPSNPIFEHPYEYAGQSRGEKLALVRTQLGKQGADFALITALDDIAWLFNLRGSDVAYNPVFIAWALVGKKQTILFVDTNKLSKKLIKKLENEGIQVDPYEDLEKIIQSLPARSSIYFDPKQINVSLLYPIWESHDENEVEGPSIVAELKGCKNATEREHMRKVMVKDGLAMVNFLFWLEQTLGKERITEASAAEKLLSFRSGQAHFQGESFPAISGYGPNGAIVHYRAIAGEDAELKPEGIYLIDSGGQYLDGTTDITRTLALGPPSRQAQKDFTRVLQGCIDLSMASFPSGTSGQQLDILARRPLWESHANYGHGTGHGVGFFLNVHEGPQRISPAGNQISFKPGMITSNEPGIYRQGEYGMRMENLVLVTEKVAENDFGTFYSFETLTLCPIDRKLIVAEMLTVQAREWLNDYHKRVFDTLSPQLGKAQQAWLEEACAAI